jgi:phage baseplate assembly protein gpV
MSIDRLLNVLRGQAAGMDQAAARPRFGIVTSVDPATYTVRVSMQPEGVLSGWLPVLSPWVGAGWGLVCPPSPGDQVLVVAQEGDAEHGVVVGGAYSNVAPPPPAPAGELWLVHRSGSFIKLRNDGTVQGNAVRWTLSGDVYIDGTLSCSGDVLDSHGSLSELRRHYDEHTHGDPQGSRTTIPDPQD